MSSCLLHQFRGLSDCVLRVICKGYHQRQLCKLLVILEDTYHINMVTNCTPIPQMCLTLDSIIDVLDKIFGSKVFLMNQVTDWVNKLVVINLLVLPWIKRSKESNKA